MNAPKQPPWECAQCHSVNFGSFPQCLSCGAPRPAAEPPPARVKAPVPPSPGPEDTFIEQPPLQPAHHEILPPPPKFTSPAPPQEQASSPLPARPRQALQPASTPPLEMVRRQAVPEANRKPKRHPSACLLLAGLGLALVCAVGVAGYVFWEPLSNFIVTQAMEWGFGSIVEVSPSPDQNNPQVVEIPDGWRELELDEVGVRFYIPRGAVVNLHPDIEYGKVILPRSSIVVDGRTIDLQAETQIDMVWQVEDRTTTLIDRSQEWLDIQEGFEWNVPRFVEAGAGAYAWSTGTGMNAQGIGLTGWTTIYYPLKGDHSLMLFCSMWVEEAENTLVVLEKIASSAQFIY